MIDFMVEHIEAHGYSARSRKEQAALETGIAQYLKENGIARTEKRPYFQGYVLQRLEIIAPRDLVPYFVEYPTISEVNNLVLMHRMQGSLSVADRRQLYMHLQHLQEVGLAERYLPTQEIQMIFCAQ